MMAPNLVVNYSTIISNAILRFWEVKEKFTITLEELNQLQKSFIDSYEHDNYCIDVCKTQSNVNLEIIETNEWYNSGPGLFTYSELMNSPKDTILYKQIMNKI
jgi:hypothetical protein